MQVRARATFESRYGMVRAGQIFTTEPHYADDLLRLNLVEVIPTANEPDRRQAMSAAPHYTGKAPPTESPPPLSPPNPLADPQIVGGVQVSSLLRAAAASRKRTATP